LENRKSVDQKRSDILRRVKALINGEPGVFALQGSVAASWRHYRGRRLGPYYRLSYRINGRQHSLYLGADETLADEIRELLTGLRKERQTRRMLARIRRQVNKSLGEERARLRAELEKIGLRLQGAEIRGMRGLLLTSTLPMTVSHGVEAANPALGARGFTGDSHHSLHQSL
jgi:hypothetical protein